jgi:hypothetical protein
MSWGRPGSRDGHGVSFVTQTHVSGPPLLPLSDLPARVDGDLVGGRLHPDGGHGLQRGQVTF